MSFAETIQLRVYAFALAIIRFCRTLPRTDEAREIARQLRRASTGASANFRASRRGRSRAEWLAKLSVAIEELDEADHWLTLLADAGIACPPQKLHRECKELVAILTTSAATARSGARSSGSAGL